VTHGLEKSRDARCVSPPMLPVRAAALPLRRCAMIGGVALVVSIGGIAAAAALFGARPPRDASSAGELGLVRAAQPAGELGAPGLADAARSVRRPTEALSATARPAPGRRRSCRTLDVRDVMTRAAIQYDRGAAAVALALTRSALACKQTERMYWLAVLYACAAHNAAAAKQYFVKVPANLQSGIERRCQQDSIDVRSR